MAREDVVVIEDFKKILISHMKDVLMAIPAIIPQSEEDKILFKKGMIELTNLVYNLEHCENIREISRYINVQKVVEDFDTESIKTLDRRISETARNNMAKLESMIERMEEDDV